MAASKKAVKDPQEGRFKSAVFDDLDCGSIDDKLDLLNLCSVFGVSALLFALTKYNPNIRITRSTHG